MATEILRPQDCLLERIRVSPCRRRSYNHYGYGISNVNPSFSNYSNPRFNRKPAVRSERFDQRKRHHQEAASISKRSSSADDLRVSRSQNHHHGGQSLVMEKTILRRGESLDSKIRSTEISTRKDLVVTGTNRLGPDPQMVPKQVRVVDLKSPATGKADVYAGSAFSVSPAPSSLPLPSFSKKKQVPVDDSATRDLRRLLRLDF